MDQTLETAAQAATENEGAKAPAKTTRSGLMKRRAEFDELRAAGLSLREIGQKMAVPFGSIGKAVLIWRADDIAAARLAKGKAAIVSPMRQDETFPETLDGTAANNAGNNYTQGNEAEGGLNAATFPAGLSAADQDAQIARARKAALNTLTRAAQGGAATSAQVQAAKDILRHSESWRLKDQQDASTIYSTMSDGEIVQRLTDMGRLAGVVPAVTVTASPAQQASPAAVADTQDATGSTGGELPALGIESSTQHT